MYEGVWNIGLYLLATALLAVGVFLETNITAILGVVLFAAWDIGYFRTPGAFAGRTFDSALQQIQNIREHISYLMAFYGVLFGILFAQGSTRQSEVIELVRGSGIPIWLLVVPLLSAAIPLMFVPIRLAGSGDQSPSAALRALLSFTSLMQKVSIFLFLHVTLRILSELASIAGVVP